MRVVARDSRVDEAVADDGAVGQLDPTDVARADRAAALAGRDLLPDGEGSILVGQDPAVAEILEGRGHPQAARTAAS
jgi:hypothetical protein